MNYGRVRRPFPIAKALDDALLAWGVNGEPLLPDHGYPVRLVLPGWVGIGSIKWLGSLEVSTTELTSPWNTKWYRMTGGSFPADSPPLTVNPVRSACELPWARRDPPPARKVRLTGRSWSGAGPIAAVDVSTDGGATWRRRTIAAVAARLDPVALAAPRTAPTSCCTGHRRRGRPSRRAPGRQRLLLRCVARIR